ncbi:hypothetical protein FB567DRAFT_540970 [Paraphoma chrysanthemicola]|uniref:F-box domain-containing protein n=1 Tax=Paraphoma chrysanthemicola TaxID=798071 RepID=A0A8K0QU30_9PLEO|nr:hypothetical protein FB567DRAFT_540970 [Paraphoma chrysanthemicola]
MPSITTLSDDLLYYIAELLEHDRPTLYALCLVSRRFCCAAQGLLFRHAGDVDHKKFHLVSRSLSEKPDLSRHVHSFRIALDEGQLDEENLKHVLAFPNIRALTFRRVDTPKRINARGMEALKERFLLLRQGREVERDFECGFLDMYALKGIRTIQLQVDFTSSEILRFMLVPGLQSLCAEYIGILWEPHIHTIPTQTKSSLTKLSILGGGVWQCSPSTLQCLLSFCSSLKHLRCKIPMYTSIDPMEPQKSSVSCSVRPWQLTNTFKHVHNTLVTLSLLNMRHSVPYDGSVMDLSEFKVLRDLEITSCCIMPPGPPCAERNSLAGRLPATLRRLKLEFPRETGIFYHHGEGDAFLNQDPANIPETRYYWISQLLYHKPMHVPDLVSIDMTDPPGRIGYYFWKNEPWAMPPDIADLSKAMEVQLSVHISYPRPGSNMDIWNERGCKPRWLVEEYNYSY